MRLAIEKLKPTAIYSPNQSPGPFPASFPELIGYPKISIFLISHSQSEPCKTHS